MRTYSIVITLSGVLALSSLLHGKGELALSPPSQSATDLFGPVAVALANVNGDSLLDAVIVSADDRMYACHEGGGDGSFGERIASGDLYLDPSDLVVGDFNGDEILDIAAINSACSS